MKWIEDMNNELINVALISWFSFGKFSIKAFNGDSSFDLYSFREREVWDSLAEESKKERRKYNVTQDAYVKVITGALREFIKDEKDYFFSIPEVIERLKRIKEEREKKK